MALPDFFVIGAPKAGTTALHAALAAHPGLFMSRVKEPTFFISDGPPPSRGGGPGDVQTYREHIWRRAEYEALFAGAPRGALRGESTPFYLYRTDAQKRIRALIPDAKLIVILRDPVERAHSNWTHLWSAGLDPIGNFVEACAEEDARVAAGWADFWHYTRLGKYGEQLENLFLHFPQEQVFILRYRALIDAPAQTLDDICDFLGVHAGVVGHVPKQNVTAQPQQTLAHMTVSKLLRGAVAASRHLPGSTGAALTQPLERFLQQNAGTRQPLSWEQRQAVLPYFEDDIRLLERITETYFGDWLQPRERSGGLVGARPAGQYQARNGRVHT
jgi:hypothetical protein